MKRDVGAFRERPDSSLEGRTEKQQQQYGKNIAASVDGLRARYVPSTEQNCFGELSPPSE